MTPGLSFIFMKWRVGAAGGVSGNRNGGAGGGGQFNGVINMGGYLETFMLRASSSSQRREYTTQLITGVAEAAIGDIITLCRPVNTWR